MQDMSRVVIAKQKLQLYSVVFILHNSFTAYVINIYKGLLFGSFSLSVTSAARACLAAVLAPQLTSVISEHEFAL